MKSFQGTTIDRDNDGAVFFSYAFVETVLRDSEVMEEVFEEGKETLRLFPEILDDESFPVSFMEQGNGQSDLPMEMPAD